MIWQYFYDSLKNTGFHFDIITYMLSQEFDLENRKVIGTGIILDTIRFKHELSNYFKVNIENINAYVLGVHGEFIVPMYSMANICGINLYEYAAVLEW